MAKPVDLIKEYQGGFQETLRAEDINALIAFAKQQQTILGFQGGVSAQQYRAPKTNPNYIECLNSTGATLLKYSVFSITGAPTFYDPPLGIVAKVGVSNPGSPFVYLTNDHWDIPDDARAGARIIPFDEPTLLLVDAANAPEIGMPCGVDFDTYRLTNHRTGFICLSDVTTADGNDYIWASRTREPIKVAGVAYGAITAYNAGTTVLGSGYDRVKYRSNAAANALADGTAPQAGTGPMYVQVWNKGEAVADGAIVTATDALGIGLLVDSIAEAEEGIPFINSVGSGTTIPAYAVLRPTGFSGGILTCAKINTTFRRKVFVNGPSPVLDGAQGLGTWLEKSNATYGRVLIGSGTPGLDDEYGVKNNEFGLFANRPGFQIIGDYDGGTTTARAIQREVTELIGKISGSTHNKGTSANVNIWFGVAGSEAVSEFAVAAYNRTINITDNTKFMSLGFRNGNWYVAPMEC